MVKLGKPCQLLSVARHVALLSRSSQVVHDRVRIRKTSALDDPIYDAGREPPGHPLRPTRQVPPAHCQVALVPSLYRWLPSGFPSLRQGLFGLRNEVAELKNCPQNIAALFEASQAMAHGALGSFNDVAPFLPSAVQGFLRPQLRNKRLEHRR